MSLPIKVSLNDYYRNDSWEGIYIEPITIDGEIPSNTLALCRMQFRDKYGELGYALSSIPASGIGDITIDDAIIWEVTVPEQVLDLTAGIWYWDIECIDSEDRVYTICRGKFKVIEDITK